MMDNHDLEILRLPCKLIIQTLSEFFSQWFVQRMNLFFMCENLSRFKKKYESKEITSNDELCFNRCFELPSIETVNRIAYFF